MQIASIMRRTSSGSDNSVELVAGLGVPGSLAVGSSSVAWLLDELVSWFSSAVAGSADLGGSCELCPGLIT